jgi:uncharacterized protein (TIGR04255 family)
MADRLPSRLKKEPLCDAICEVRFAASTPASSILPGIFFSKLDGEKTIQRLPAAELPKKMRDADPNLQYAPVMRIVWKEFLILVSDRSVVIACKLPYAGWNKFKETIIIVIGILGGISIIERIQRYSLKYIDLIPIENIAEQVASVNLSISLGDHRLEKEIFQFRIELVDGEYINAVQIAAAGVFTNEEGTTKQGLIIDVDTIRKVDDDAKTFISELEGRLEEIHKRNKETFFKCLTPATLAMLEPIYE